MGHEGLPPDRLLTRKEVSEHFGISTRWLEVAAVKGGGPTYVKVGRLAKYQVQTLREWIASQQRCSTSDPGSLE